MSEHWPLYTAETALEQAGFDNIESRVFDYRLQLPDADGFVGAGRTGILTATVPR